MITAIKQGQTKDLRRMLEAGLSPNACNVHGESLLHMVCRRGNWELFQVLTDSRFHVDLQVADDYGRTPLHDACWSSYPNFSLVRHLLRTDANFLFLKDKRGSLPLKYVPKSHWALWNGFLEQVVDEVFPLSQSMDEGVPLLCLGAPNSRPVRDPTNNGVPFSLADIDMVANGIMEPEEVLLAMTDMGELADDVSVSSESENDVSREIENEVWGDDNVSREIENEVSGESEYEGEYTTDEHGADVNDNQDEGDDDVDSSSSAFYEKAPMPLVQTFYYSVREPRS
jgi:hypothetical protein